MMKLYGYLLARTSRRSKALLPHVLIGKTDTLLATHRSSQPNVSWLIGIASALAAVVMANAAQGASYRVIYDFRGFPDGGNPTGGVSADSSGNLYGLTLQNGPDLNTGIVYRLDKPTSQSAPWTEEVLHIFDRASEGGNPLAPLLLGPSGEIYGTLTSSGIHNRGSVFRLDNAPGWPITILHAFRRGGDASDVQGGLVFGQDGLLYGNGSLGGPQAQGATFSISPLGDAVEYAIINKFGNRDKGYSPIAGLTVRGGQNDLFGTTAAGGLNLGGTAFYLHRDTAGSWRQKIIYNFLASSATDVFAPQNPLVLGSGAYRGVLFGCASGGTHGLGGIFTLTPTGSGQFTEAVIYNFGDQSGDPAIGGRNQCNLTPTTDGGFAGFSDAGGVNNTGAFFTLAPPAAGGTAWSLSVPFSFSARAVEGASPVGPPLRIGGVYYGTCFFGGAANVGVVFRLTP